MMPPGMSGYLLLSCVRWRPIHAAAIPPRRKADTDADGQIGKQREGKVSDCDDLGRSAQSEMRGRTAIGGGFFPSSGQGGNKWAGRCPDFSL